MKKIASRLCWRLLLKCHNLNKSVVKGRWNSNSSYSKRIYAQKDELLNTCISRIKDENLKIKMGYQLCDNLWYPYILYFEFNGDQVSFHSDISYGLHPFRGEWIGYTQGLMRDLNGKIPGNVNKKRRK